MEEDNDFITEFIDERIDRILVDVRHNNDEYKQAMKEYHQLYDKLNKQLTDEQHLLLDEMLSALNGMSAVEVEKLYRCAVKDYLDFMKLFTGK